jgi:hypothetical protein
MCTARALRSTLWRYAGYETRSELVKFLLEKGANLKKSLYVRAARELIRDNGLLPPSILGKFPKGSIKRTFSKYNKDDTEGTKPPYHSASLFSIDWAQYTPNVGTLSN